jgi:phosphonoacetaldehyde hydrolase
MRPSLVVFDWAGTLVDFGCQAPVVALQAAFAEAGVPISEGEARGAMGAHKRDHVRAILYDPMVVPRVAMARGQGPDAALVEAVYQTFAARLPSALQAHATPIPGAEATLAWLRARGVPMGGTTGYTRSMMDVLAPAAAATGIALDVVVCADEVSQGRPAPWGCFRVAEQLGVYPLTGALKVGDTPADMAEGRNAGMLCVGVADSGNEVGLDAVTWASLLPGDQDRRREAAAQRLRDAGAQVVLPSVAALPTWLERSWG